MSVSILAISGSLRAKSFNTMLARAAVDAAAGDARVDVVTLHDIPLYDGDVEASSRAPAAVAKLKDRVAAADALLLVTPEYNGSLPGVFKNAIDWLSRPSADIARVFGGIPAGVIGATPGPGATRLAQAAWLPVLWRLGAVVFGGKTLGLANATKLFDEAGGLVDAPSREQLARYLEAFAAFAAQHRRAPASRG